MNRRLPAVQPTRVIHYVDAATPAELAYPMNPGQLAARQREQREIYLHWRLRQEAIAERDRKVRRFWYGFGAIIALAVIGALVFAGWMVYQFLAGLSLGVLAVPALIGLVLLLGVGGHKCVTVVQHWH